METRKCKYCGRAFETDRKNQKFCCQSCGREWWKVHAPEHPEDLEAIPGLPIREFRCAYCGKFVYVRNRNDHRTRFCCQRCEDRYWKHPQEGRRWLRITYGGRRYTVLAGLLKCKECKHCKSYLNEAGKPVMKCTKSLPHRFLDPKVKRHPRWCPMVQKKKAR